LAFALLLGLSAAAWAIPPGGHYNGVYIGGNPSSGSGRDSGIYTGGNVGGYHRGYDGVYIGGAGTENNYYRYGIGREEYVLPRYPEEPPPAASIVVRVPQEADVWFQGVKMPGAGNVRNFVSPPLDPAKSYSYVVRARWAQDGKTADETRKISVHAGDRIRLDFPNPERP
jgi:uncharacterized protein (TIGR03000 family)